MLRTVYNIGLSMAEAAKSLAHKSLAHTVIDPLQKVVSDQIHNSLFFK